MTGKTVAAAGILLAAALICIFYVAVGSIRIETLMWDYLEQQSCPEADIERLKVRHSFADLLLSYNEWSIEVVYRDEPGSIYYYTVRDGAICSTGVTGTGEKEALKH